MSLELIIGCMYSGKSTELIRRVKCLTTIQQPYIIYNSSLDTRYGHSGVFTHNQSHIGCQIVDNLIDMGCKTYSWNFLNIPYCREIK